MEKTMRRQSQGEHFTVGRSPKPLKDGGVFRDIRTGRFVTTREMNSGVYKEATSRANEKIREYTRPATDTGKR